MKSGGLQREYKTKGSPKFRFYALYDKVYREDVMAFPYEVAKC